MYFQVVGESGLFNPDDVAFVQNAGVSVVSRRTALGLSKLFLHDLEKHYFFLSMYISFVPQNICY
jgi:hypothetical protein